MKRTCKWNHNKKDECLDKFRTKFQDFQRRFEDERQSMMASLPVIELIHGAAENMKINKNTRTHVNVNLIGRILIACEPSKISFFSFERTHKYHYKHT